MRPFSVRTRLTIDLGSHGLHRKFSSFRILLFTTRLPLEISVNASIISDTGGTCVCPPTSTDLCQSDAAYNACVAEVQRDLITTTAAVSALASFLMGLIANLPVGMAPGLGLNAYVSGSGGDRLYGIPPQAKKLN